MNSVIILGRIVNELSPKYLDSGMCVNRFTVAVDRPKKQGESKRQSDFIDCVSFGKTAEVIGNYFSKGDRILVDGRIQTNTYENKEGKKVKSFDVVVNVFEFIEKPKSKQQESSNSFADFGEEDVMF